MSVATEPEARLLVVEDEPNLVELLSSALRYAGFSVDTATSGIGRGVAARRDRRRGGGGGDRHGLRRLSGIAGCQARSHRCVEVRVTESRQFGLTTALAPPPPRRRGPTRLLAGAAVLVLAAAQLTLQRALDGETTTSAGDSSATSGGGVHAESAGTAQPATLATSDATAPSPSSPSSSDQLRANQQAVLNAQQTVDAKLEAAKQAVGAASSACAGGRSTPPTTTSATLAPSPTTTAPPGSGSSPSEACTQALNTALVTEQALATAQQALTSAATTLTATLGTTHRPQCGPTAPTPRSPPRW